MSFVSNSSGSFNTKLMGGLMFLICLNQNLMRGIKDSLISINLGPEFIGFVKIFCEIPAGLLFVFFYIKMCNRFSARQIFILVVSGFVVYFLFFSIFVCETIHDRSPEINKPEIDNYGSVWILLWNNIGITMFYVFAEMWPVIMTMFFWQLANSSVSLIDAPKIYPILSILGQVSLILSGIVLNHISSLSSYFGFSGIKILISALIVSSLVLIIVYLKIEPSSARIKPRQENKSSEIDSKSYTDNLVALGVFESLKVVVKSKYLLLISLVCLSYHMSVNLIEFVWFSKIKQVYTTQNEFMEFHGKILYCTGIFSVLLGCFGKRIITKFRWLISAILTPVMMLLFGGIFFISLIFDEQLIYLALCTHQYVALFIDILPYTALESLNELKITWEIYHAREYLVLFLPLFFGALQNILGRGTKYALFDATREMLYIPLNEEMKSKGKAAVDVIGMKVGRALSAVIQIMLFGVYFASQNFAVSLIFVIYVGICVVWIFCLKSLSSHLVFKK